MNEGSVVFSEISSEEEISSEDYSHEEEEMEVNEDLMEEEEMDLHTYLEDTNVECEQLNERLERSNKTLYNQLKEFNKLRSLEVAKLKNKNEDLMNQVADLSTENNRLKIEWKQSQERIEDLENEELKQNEMIKDLTTVKLKNEQDFIKKVAEIKLQNIELICK